jgi:hypothetical protein
MEHYRIHMENTKLYNTNRKYRIQIEIMQYKWEIIQYKWKI